MTIRRPIDGSVWVLAVAVAACGGKRAPVDSAGTSSTAGPGSTSSEAATTSSSGHSSGPADSSDAESSSGGLAPIDCTLRNPEYECPPMDCAAPTNGYECGTIAMDEDGCLRPFCRAASDCPDDLVCYKHSECDPTAFCWTFAGCAFEGGECSCGAVGGCPTEAPPFDLQWGHCIPPALRPC